VEEEELRVLLLGILVDRVVADVVTQHRLGRGQWLVVWVFLAKALLEAWATVMTKLVTFLAQAEAANHP